jgi:excisionase family DNA binding protein
MLSETHQGELLTVEETAARLKLHPMTVRKLVKAGINPAFQIRGKGSAIRIPEDELREWLESQPEDAA